MQGLPRKSSLELRSAEDGTSSCQALINNMFAQVKGLPLSLVNTDKTMEQGLL